eukprot:gene25360-11022_t
MVQAQPNITLTLKQLGPLGAVVSAEQAAAFDHSFPIKRAETGLKTLTLWGRFTTQNGKDYLIAEGHNDALLHGSKVQFDAKYFYSQDGVKWVDLQAVDAETSKRASTIRTLLMGDPSKVHEIQEDDPNAPRPAVGEDGEPIPDEEGPKKLAFQIPELAVLRTKIDSINATCGVIPVGALQADALNHVVPNKLFSGAPNPEKLESYMHRTLAPGGPTLAQDLRGVWSLHYDPFKSVATLRSLLYPGYFFFFNAYEATWGSLAGLLGS